MIEFLILARIDWNPPGSQYDARVVRASDASAASNMSGYQSSSIVRVERLTPVI